MLTFNDLEFNPHSAVSGQRAVVLFPNGLELSVVFGELFYSNGIDTYEAWCRELEESPRAYLTADEVTAYMAEIQQVQPDHPNQQTL